MWYHPPQVVVASALGYISIGCWLCAQLPQVLKNISLQSCEGLSLPFLVNWLFGDLTNLIGCLLTDQLPFQTYLATYFCIIDFTLLVQYFYYAHPKPSHHHHHHAHHHHVHYSSVSLHGSAPATAAASPIQPVSALTESPTTTTAPNSHFQRGSKRKHSQSTSQLFGSVADLGMTSPGPLPGATDSYQDLYQAALDVARAAERVSSRRSESRRRRLSRQTTANTMMESFHSELSSTSVAELDNEEREDRDRKKMSQSTGDLLDDRGRSMRRSTTRLGGIIDTPVPGTPTTREELDQLQSLPGEPSGIVTIADRPSIARSKSRSQSVARTTSGRGKARRAAGVAFMSFTLLARFAPTANFSSSVSPATSGTVIGADSAAAPPIRHPQPFLSAPPPSSSPTYLLFEHSSHPDEPPEPPSFKRLVGRTSAWACTTLYLTSRLPQIWKNFMRKSVEGLSIFLFFFAFCGNLTYVASILLNPAGSASPSDAGHYLLEALPYLLGSGGTLLFDLTIMIQSMIYGSAPPIADSTSPAPPRRKAFRRRRTQASTDGHGHDHDGHGHERQPLLRERSTSPETTYRAGSSAKSPV